jgi:lipoyl(octanoyl) transferase
LSQPGLPLCHVFRVGMLPYLDALALQDRYAAEIASGARPPCLILLEHPHTYTFGSRSLQQHLLWSKNELATRDVDVHWADHGGNVTYHGPGQLAGYPLLPLGGIKANGRLPQSDYVGYMRRLEKVLITALARLGLPSGQIHGLTGVWVQPDVASRCRFCPPRARKLPSKIAAIGVKVDAHGISRHGFTLNLNPDMSYWQGIIACGIRDYAAIALADLLDPQPTMETVMDEVVNAFHEIFDYALKEMTPSA